MCRTLWPISVGNRFWSIKGYFLSLFLLFFSFLFFSFFLFFFLPFSFFLFLFVFLRCQSTFLLDYEQILLEEKNIPGSDLKLKDRELFRPGFVRLNFNYFVPEEEFQYVLKGIFGFCLLRCCF